MKLILWNDEKNQILKQTRGISFEEAVTAIIEHELLDIVVHPNKKRYPNQQLFIIALHDYAYIIPFIEDETKIFLKTIIPSRIYTKKYLEKGVTHESSK